MVDPLQWACGACAAQPGEPCVWAVVRPSELYHAERIEAAAGVEDVGEMPARDEFEQAVQESGLV